MLPFVVIAVFLVVLGLLNWLSEHVPGWLAVCISLVVAGLSAAMLEAVDIST